MFLYSAIHRLICLAGGTSWSSSGGGIPAARRSLCINKTKTKFVVNNTKAAKALNTMRGEGDPQVTDLVRDLGVDSACAKRRRVTQALKRFKVGRARNQKLHRLGTGGKAHRLYATSILTAEIYGHQGQGLSPKRLKVVRASISRHVGRSKWGSVDVTLDY